MDSESQHYNKKLISFPANTLPDRLNPMLRLNAICPYYTMFPIDFPFNALSDAKPGDWVLDPFCGRGTTNYAARLKKIPSVGIDSNPVATAIASAKFVKVKPEKIVKLCQNLLNEDGEPDEIPQETFWGYCYHPDTLAQICKLREKLLTDCSSDEKIALRALLLGILHGPVRKGLPSYLSNQMPRTYATKPNSAINFWKNKAMSPANIDVLDVVKRKAHFVFSHLPPKGKGRILQSDSRDPLKKIARTEFKWVVTSPPYYGMNTYTQDQWLRKWFVGGESVVNYNQHSQLAHGSELEFTNALSQVWKNITNVCSDGAHLIIRFGSLPSLKSDPALLLEKSLSSTADEWNIIDVNDAGISPRGKRQAEQFNNNYLGNARNEIDLHAIFTG